MRRTKKLAGLALSLLALVSLGLTACGGENVTPGLPATRSPSASPTSGLKGWSGTITMYAQRYTPDSNGAKTPLKAFRAVADEYESLHPGLKIQFVDQKFQDYNEVVRTKAAQGELWDVFWAQWESFNNGRLPAGIAQNLTPYFKQKNPYVPDGQNWDFVMNSNTIKETAAPGGISYNINADFMATGFFYNKKLFEKAGIFQPARSWTELLADCRKLRDAGIQPSPGIPNFSWWSRHFLSDFYYKDYDTIAGFDKLPGVSTLDEAVAINKGILSTKDPRFMGWWPIFKQFSDFWPKNYLAQPLDNADKAFQDFANGQAAIYYTGSWAFNDLRDAGVNFEVGVFNFPLIGSEVTPLSNGVDVSNAGGGPGAGYQFALSSPSSNRTLAEPGKAEAVLDWLRYIGTTKVAERVINEEGSFISLWPRVAPKPGSELLISQANLRSRTVRVGLSSPALEATLQRTFSDYLAGTVGLDVASQTVQVALDKAAQDYAALYKLNYADFK